MTLASSKGIEQYIIDLLLFDGRNTWIIDYKVSQPEVDQEKSQFVEQQLTKYYNIMHRYGEAITYMGYESVRLALYFPEISHFAEYTSD